MSKELVTFSEMERLANAVSKSGLFGMKRPEEALALMAIAHAEGYHPALAAQDYHIISGRPALKADAILARFQRAGGTVKWNEYTDARVSGTFHHPQGGEITVDWDLERAKQAGVLGNPTWKKYPRNMMRARVVSEAVRAIFPSPMVGMYTPEELEDVAAEKESRAKPTGTLREKLGLPESQEVQAISVPNVPEISQLDSILQLVANAATLEELKKAGQYAKSLSPEEKEILRPLYEAKLESFKEGKEQE